MLILGFRFFLCLSGYLFGNRTIDEIGKFYKKRALRILVPYYLLLSVTIIANLAKGANLGVKEIAGSVFCQQWFGPTVPNCGHLWYISCILGCYLLTPIMQAFCSSLCKKSTLIYWGSVFGSVAALLLFPIISGVLSGIHFIGVYFLGYSYAVFLRNGKKPINGRLITVGLVLASLGFAAIYVMDVRGHALPGIVFECYKLGFAAIICLAFSKRKKAFNNRGWECLVTFSDKYSYGVYLAHHIFILGPLSVMRVGLPLGVCAAMAFVLSIAGAIVLTNVSEWLIAPKKRRRI